MGIDEVGIDKVERYQIYHVRNVIGRENLITCGRMNELTHALMTEYTCSVAKALWLTERNSTALCYLAVRQAMVSVNDRYIRKLH